MAMDSLYSSALATYAIVLLLGKKPVELSSAEFRSQLDVSRTGNEFVACL